MAARRIKSGPSIRRRPTTAPGANIFIMVTIPKGCTWSGWRHAAGCRRWFNVARDTVSHEIIEVYVAGDLPRDAAARAVHAANWRRAEESG